MALRDNGALLTRQDCVRLSVDILEEAKTLEVLRLVVPVTFRFDDFVDSSELNMSRLIGAGVKVVLVQLYREDEYQADTGEPSEQLVFSWRSDPKRLGGDPRVWAESMGWNSTRAWYDFRGRYPIHTSHNCTRKDDPEALEWPPWQGDECECDVAVAARAWYIDEGREVGALEPSKLIESKV